MPQTTASKELKKILIVEDEGDMCLLLNIILKDEQIDLEHVKTLDAARKYLSEETPALVMLDNKLPDGLGLDFIEYIRKNNPGIKILMISGFHPATAEDIALHNGADGFLAKPFTKDLVLQSVQSLLN
ncbi:MAG: response regulator [Ferruginibacter sp.]|nr:response regulator [Ferruginibacter sp.]